MADGRWREGSKGWLAGRFVAVRCWRVTSDGRRRIGWLIGERPAPTASGATTGATSGRTRRWSRWWSTRHRRHWVEQFHEEAKGLLGWDQYQGRLWTGFHRQRCV